MQTASTEELKTKTQELSLTLQKLGQNMYGQNAQDAGNTGPTGGQNPNPNQGPNETGPVEGEVVN